jgi:hypothetical protein
MRRKISVLRTCSVFHVKQIQLHEHDEEKMERIVIRRQSESPRILEIVKAGEGASYGLIVAGIGSHEEARRLAMQASFALRLPVFNLVDAPS